MKHICVAALWIGLVPALFAFFAADAVHAQGWVTVSVFVTDAETGKPVEGAAVKNGEVNHITFDPRIDSLTGRAYEDRGRSGGGSPQYTDKDGYVRQLASRLFLANEFRWLTVEKRGYEKYDFARATGRNFAVPDQYENVISVALKPLTLPKPSPVPPKSTPTSDPKPDRNCISLGIRQPREEGDAVLFPCVGEITLNVPADGSKLQQLQSTLVSGTVEIKTGREALPAEKWGIALELRGARKDSANTDRDLELVRKIVDLPGPAVPAMSTQKVPVMFSWTVPPIPSNYALYLRMSVGPRDVTTWPVKWVQGRILITDSGMPTPQPKPTPAEPPRYKELSERLDVLERKINRVMEELRSELQELRRSLKSLQTAPMH